MTKDKNENLINAEPFVIEEFLTYEKDRAKAVVFVFIAGFLLALASAYLYVIGLWYVAVLFFFVLVLFLKYVLNFFKIPFPKRGSHKFLIYAQLFLTWLIFWIVFLNPPFNVVSGPQIGAPQTYVSTTHSWTGLPQYSSGIYEIPRNDYSLRVSVSFIHPVTEYSVSTTTSGYSIVNQNLNGGYIYFNISSSPTYYQDISIVISASYQSHSSTEIFALMLQPP